MKKAGFTIIELMIVLAIIGIFAALAIPAYQSYVNRAKISEGYNFAGYYTVAIAEYYNEKGSFPNNLGQVGTPSQNVQAHYVSSVCMQNGGAFQVLFSGDPITGALQYVPTVGSSGNINWGCYGILIPTEWIPHQCQNTDIIYNRSGLLIINRIVNGQTKRLAYAYPCPEYQSSSTAGVLSSSSIDFVQNMYEYMRDRFGYTNDQIATVYNSYSKYLQNMQESWYVENTSGDAYQTLQCGNGYSPGYTFGYMIEIGSVVSAGVCPASAPIIWNCQKWADGAFVVDPNSRWTCGPDHP